MIVAESGTQRGPAERSVMVWRIDDQYSPSSRRVPGLTIIFFILALVILSLFLEPYLGSTAFGLIIPVGAAGIWLALRWSSRRAVLRFLRVIAKAGREPTPQTLSEAYAASRGFAPITMIAHIVRRHLPRLWAVCMVSESSAGPPPLAPAFSAGFMPVRLRESDPAFRALADLPSTPETGASDFVFTALKYALLSIVFCVCLRPVLGTQTWRSVCLGVLLTVGMLVAWRSGPRETFLVPGGIVVRYARWRSDRWKLIELHRDDCTLLCWSSGAAIASDRFVWQLELSPVELHTLLRAWFSDAPRQPLEKMDDLR